MELTPEIIKRLSFIKYFYESAREQSKLPPPQNFISVLMFHDSVELFLHLSAEFLDANLDNINFMKYFKRIDEKLGDLNLNQKAAMNTLNKERVSLKHYNLYPNPENIENHRVNTQNFFNENCAVIFGIEFSEISLLDLVQDIEVKKILSDAQNYFNKTQYKEAQECIGIAFYALLENYKESKSTFGRSLFDIGENLTFVGKFEKFNDGLENVIETVKSMQHILKPIIFNIDYRKYIKFRMYTPSLIYNGTSYYDKYSLIWDSSNVTLEKEQVDYCFTFVIETAIRLQQFDFTLEKDFHYFSDFY